MRHIAFFDDDFKKSHPEIPVDKRTDDTDVDKEMGDSRTLLPVLRDFNGNHPALRYDITSADKDRKARDGGRNWKRQGDDAVICA